MTMFGAWLLQRNRATATQIISALDAQTKARPALQDLAVRVGLITAAEALSVLDEQQRTGQCFTVIAVARRLMDRRQADELRKEQAKHGPRLGEILVMMGVLTSNELETELAAFHEATLGPPSQDPRRRPSPSPWRARVT
jgi:urease accessory protein UreF